MHLVQGVRIPCIDRDEQHEHVGRFLEYLGGRKLTPRDAKDAAQIELHHDDGVVILDLSGLDEELARSIFAAWATVVKRHGGCSVRFLKASTSASLCKIALCQRPDHLELVTKPDNSRRRGPTRGPRRQQP